MIEGFKDLSSNISQTMNLIDDIQNASKEQLMGIEQINDAVNQLDQQTQQNAAIATQAHDIALGTDEIARMIVEDVDAKEFNGKNSVKARENNISQKTQNFETKSVKKVNIARQNTIQAKKIVDTSSDDEWESF